MIEIGIPLTKTIEIKQVAGKNVFFVKGTELLAYFGANGELDKEFSRALSDLQPQKIAFCDAVFSGDKAKINYIELFKQLSKETKFYVL